MEVTAAEVRAARLRLGMTQAELAEALGYAHKQSISDLERGVNKPPKAVQMLLRMLIAQSDRAP
jgi:transcriptional regulator with XRE-family HTH domain